MPDYGTPWTCICCGGQHEKVASGCVLFDSQGGNYGSTVYDDIAGGQPTRVRAYVCDDCFVTKVKDKTLRSFMDSRPSPESYEVTWDPRSRDNDLSDPRMGQKGDSVVADEVISRLNHLIKDPAVAQALNAAIDNRFNVSADVADHPTIQVTKLNDGLEDHFQVGFLGLLNGLIGVIPEGENKDWGYITALYDDDGNLTSFERTENTHIVKDGGD